MKLSNRLLDFIEDLRNDINSTVFVCTVVFINGLVLYAIVLALYSTTHVNHPSAIWVRQSYANYVWLSKLLTALCEEYTYRYGKIHKVERDGLEEELMYPPNNIPVILEFTEPTPAMPDEVKIAGDSLASYKNYYIKNKAHLASWKKRNIPEWYANV